MLVNPPADIPVPTVQLLIKELNDVDDWYMFGVILGVPVSQLKKIKSSNPHGGVERWLVDMFDYWIKNSDPSWREIFEALASLKRRDLAAQVEKKYLSSPIPATTVGKREVLAFL